MSTRLRRTNLLLSTAVAFGLLLNWTWVPDTTKPNYVSMPEMVDSPAFRPFSKNPYLPNGRTLQHPPQYSLPRGTIRYRFGTTAEEATRAGNELKSPLRMVDDSTLRQGKSIFDTFCFPCHGSEAQGDGPVVLRGFPAPPPLTAEKAIGLKDGQIFHIISHGQGNMPSYRTLVSPEERWLVITYVRSMQKPGAPQ